MSYLHDFLQRIRSNLRWVGAQFLGMLLLVAIGLAWTRLPDKHVWQVLLSLLIPLVLAASFLWLQASTMRALLGSEERRVKLVWGALTLVAWALVIWVAWAALDWCDDNLWDWAGYLNSQAPAQWRARIFTYQHIDDWLTLAEWILRWIVVPGLVLPCALPSAQAGWRAPWRRALRLCSNWRWWPAMIAAALAAAALPAHLFSAEPHGAVSRQIWAVVLKLTASYLAVMAAWLLLLAWAAMLFARQPQPADDGLDQRLFARLKMGRKWIWGSAGWLAAAILGGIAESIFPERIRISGWFQAPVAIAFVAAIFLLQVGLVRSMLQDERKRVRPIWGALSALLWLTLGITGSTFLSSWNHEIAGWILGWAVLPALFLPFAAGSAQWGFKLPWRRVLSVVCNWRWWLGILAAVIVGYGLSAIIHGLLSSPTTSEPAWEDVLRAHATDPVGIGAWVVLLGWFAVLVTREVTSPGSLEAASVPLPAPEAGGNVAGNP